MINRPVTKKLISGWKTVYNIPRHCLLIPAATFFLRTERQFIEAFAPSARRMVATEVINERPEF